MAFATIHALHLHRRRPALKGRGNAGNLGRAATGTPTRDRDSPDRVALPACRGLQDAKVSSKIDPMTHAPDKQSLVGI
jgi:hypothetical protein